MFRRSNAVIPTRGDGDAFRSAWANLSIRTARSRLQVGSEPGLLSVSGLLARPQLLPHPEPIRSRCCQLKCGIWGAMKYATAAQVGFQWTERACMSGRILLLLHTARQTGRGLWCLLVHHFRSQGPWIVFGFYFYIDMLSAPRGLSCAWEAPAESQSKIMHVAESELSGKYLIESFLARRIRRKRERYEIPLAIGSNFC